MLIEAEDDIDGDIAAAITSLSGDAGTTVVEPVQPPAEAPPESPKADDGRPRDETGKFVAKPGEAAQDSTATPQPAPEPQQEAIRPPVSWSATAKADFASLPPHIQQEVLKREQDVQNGLAQWETKGERLNKFDALFAPFKEKFALSGLDEYAAVQQLLAAHQYLERDPNGAIAHLARQYGAQPQAFQGQTQNLPPEQQGFAELQREIADLRAERQREVQEREQAAKSDAVAEWTKFRDDPANPYAVNVQEHMHALLSGGRASNLKDAYDQAVWANPETRALLQRQVAAPAPLKDVKPAGLGVAGGPGTVRRPVGDVNPETSLEDDIRESIRSLGGRA